tara:strand:- start:1070 stop:1219 length:150 start_codon:yes stop_codon:yes gene_type:complete
MEKNRILEVLNCCLLACEESETSEEEIKALFGAETAGIGIKLYKHLKSL